MTTEITLSYPVEADGETITSITLRRPTFGDAERFSKEKDKMKSAVLMITTLGNVSPDAVRALDIEDFAAVSEAVEGFFP